MLSYSGGLDTSIIIPWLKEHYANAQIYGICVNVGQKEDWDEIVAKGKRFGAEEIRIADMRDVFCEDYLLPLIKSGAIYEDKYLLGTAIARPLQAYCQVAYARELGARCVAHGCTGKGNDQIRFELAYRALAPDLEIIAPWRVWNIRSREEAIDYAHTRGIPLGPITKKSIYSRDENIWHTSHEGGELENTWNAPDEAMFQRTSSLADTPDTPEHLVIRFSHARPTMINQEAMDPRTLIIKLNAYAARHGIGRADLVETRLVGMKSRGVYETPGGTLLFNALRDLEMITMDKDTLAIKRTLAIRYAEEVYAGKWFNHFRKSLDAYMDYATRYVEGEVRLKLFKGACHVVGRHSPHSLYIDSIASFSDSDSYKHSDADGFIQLYGLPTGVEALVHKSNDSMISSNIQQVSPNNGAEKGAEKTGESLTQNEEQYSPIRESGVPSLQTSQNIAEKTAENITEKTTEKVPPKIPEKTNKKKEAPLAVERNQLSLIKEMGHFNKE